MVNAQITKDALPKNLYNKIDIRTFPFEIIQTILRVIISIIGVMVTFSLGLTTTIIKFFIQITIEFLLVLNIFPGLVTKLLNYTEHLDKILLLSLLLFVAFAAYLSGIIEDITNQNSTNTPCIQTNIKNHS